MSDTHGGLRTHTSASTSQVSVDSDWAGRHVTRRPSTGGVIGVNNAIATFWVRMQATAAPSSRDPDLYAIGPVKARDSLFVLEMWREVRTEIRTDSQVARAASLSYGLRKVKRIELKFLFLQEMTMRGEITITCTEGKSNPAKPVTREDLERIRPSVGLVAKTNGKEPTDDICALVDRCGRDLRSRECVRSVRQMSSWWVPSSDENCTSHHEGKRHISWHPHIRRCLLLPRVQFRRRVSVSQLPSVSSCVSATC